MMLLLMLLMVMILSMLMVMILKSRGRWNTYTHPHLQAPQPKPTLFARLCRGFGRGTRPLGSDTGCLLPTRELRRSEVCSGPRRREASEGAESGIAEVRGYLRWAEVVDRTCVADIVWGWGWV